MTARVDVPCNGCVACCHQHVYLEPENGDDPEQFECELATNPLTGRQEHRLKLKPGSKTECWYLGKDGCTIHERAPAMCRHFDCRLFYKGLRERYTRAYRRKLLAEDRLHAGIVAAGKKRLRTLENG